MLHYILFKSHESLHLLSANINGLRNYKKCKRIIDHYLYPKGNQPRPDIFTFQESHSLPEFALQWNNDFSSELLYAHGEGSSRGILMGFSRSLNYHLDSYIADPAGRFIVAHVTINNKSFTIAAFYLEPQLVVQEIESTYSKITNAIMLGDNTRVIWCGDFNASINPEMDGGNTENNSCRIYLNKLMEIHELTDVFKVLHPEAKRYTCHGARTNSLSRIDLFLALPLFLPSVVDVEIPAAYLSDHTPLFLEFSLDENVRGRGYWHFPNFLLHDAVFREKLNDHVDTLLHCNSEANPALLWDTIKAGIRGTALKYLGESK